MAQVSSAKVEGFLAVGSCYGSGYGYSYCSGDGSGDGYGYGYGSGSGSDSGYGYGYGDGYGDGHGSGDGYGGGEGYGYGYDSGDGSGSGSGYGISIFCGYSVHIIDGIATLINHVHGNIAKGMILHTDLTTVPCYVCKQGSHFAHGATLREAMNALKDKLFEDMPEDERIEE